MIFPLVGNKTVLQTIKNALMQSKLPHAVVIDGPDGVGKQQLAAFLAKAAVCQGADAPCGECKGCRLATAGTHPDITIISPEQNKKTISVAQIRKMRNDAHIKAHMASRRVFIINRADQMNEQSQNALLKVLEEPPAQVMFILITRARAALLTTVLSRCVVLTLSVPERNEAAEYIISKTSKLADEVYDALQKSNGNIGLALDIISQAQKNSAYNTANEFLNLFLVDRQFEMLKLLNPLEKDRVATEEFLKSLQVCIAERLRTERKTGRKAKALAYLYEEVKKYIELLKTNANLALLFSCLVCKSKQF